MRRRSSELETQLLAAASAADRANRPRIFVIAPALLLIGALIFALVKYQRFVYAKDELASARAQVGELREVIAQAERWRAGRLPIDEIYQQNPFMDVNIDDLRKAMLGEDAGVRVGQVNRRPLGLDGQLQRADVDCRITEAPLDDVMAWVEAVEAHESLERVFVSRLDLQPGREGWNGMIRFRGYEKAQ